MKTLFEKILLAAALIALNTSASFAEQYSLVKAVENYDTEEALRFLNEGVDAETFNNALLKAKDKENIEFIKLLTDNASHVEDLKSINTDILIYAVYKGDLELVKKLVERGADVNGKGSYGYTLFTAPYNESIPYETLKYLIEHGANVNIRGYLNRNAMYKADTLEKARLLVDRGTIVNIRDDYGFVPLAGKNYEVSEYLIEHGADINVKNNKGVSLIENIYDPKIFDLYVTKGVDLKSAGITPLMTAKTLDEVKNLIAQGADVKARTPGNQTALTIAIMLNRNDIAKFLIDGQKNLNEKYGDLSYGGTSLIDTAIYAKNAEIVKYLVERGAIIDAGSGENTGLLSYGLTPELAVYFYSKGANIEAKDKYGRTPLLMFVEQNNPELVKFFIQKGAKVDIKDNNGQNALDKSSYKDPAITKMLIDAGAIADEKLFINLIKFGKLQYIKVIVENNGIKDIKHKIVDGKELKDDLDTVNILVAVAKAYDKKNSVEMAKYFIEVGADINTKGFLKSACNQNNTKLVKYILSQNLKYETILDAFDTVIENGNSTLFEAFIARIRPEDIISNGKFIEAAIKSGNPKLIAALCSIFKEPRKLIKYTFSNNYLLESYTDSVQMLLDYELKTGIPQFAATADDIKKMGLLLTVEKLASDMYIKILQEKERLRLITNENSQYVENCVKKIAQYDKLFNTLNTIKSTLEQ